MAPTFAGAKQVKNVVAGDSFVQYEGSDEVRRVYWTAVEDATTQSGVTRIKIQHWPDGGITMREWPDPDHLLYIES